MDNKKFPERIALWTPPDVLIAGIRETLASAERLFPNVSAEVVYLPVEPPRIGDPNVVREEVRATLGTPPETVVVVMVSRIEGWKGHGVLVEALGRLRDLPNWECWMVGGPQRPEEEVLFTSLQQQAKDLGVAPRIRWLGHRGDVRRLLAGADVYAQPNNEPEAFGITLVEALYAGLPVVTSKLGGALEIVDESCGVLLAPGDSAGVARELQRLIEDEKTRRRLAAGGPPRARALCDPASSLSRLAAVLLGR